MSKAPSDPRRLLRQIADTTRLMGVDFLPIAGTREVETLHKTVLLTDAAAAARPSVAAASGAAADATGGLDKAAALAALREEHDRTCPHCTKATAHTQTVFGDGDPSAGLMFVGEAPGAEEDRQGIPFVGASGKKLNEMIVAIGLSREKVYIANVLKARPLDNATPTPEEASKCGPFLHRQIEIIKPKVIVTLGKPAANFLLENRDSMTSMRGVWSTFRGIPVMPTFHPAYLLRAYTAENRQKVWSDLKQAMARLTATS